MTNDLSVVKEAAGGELAEQVAVVGDLADLTAGQRMAYYSRVCESLGINPYTQPFQYIRLNNKLTLYATRTAADQLRKRNGVSLDAPQVEIADGLCMVTITGRDASGRTDTEIGAVPMGNLQGEARANAIMKAVTKAKRRLTLSICGLGWLDETEVETIRDAQPVTVTDDGEIVDAEPEKPRAIPPEPEPPKATPPAAPLPDDEQVVYEAAGKDFINAAAANLATDADDIKARLHALGYDRIPGDKGKRLDAYRKLRDGKTVAPAPAVEAV